MERRNVQLRTLKNQMKKQNILKRLKKEFRRNSNPNLETCCETYINRLLGLVDNGVDIYERTDNENSELIYRQLDMFND